MVPICRPPFFFNDLLSPSPLAALGYSLLTIAIACWSCLSDFCGKWSNFAKILRLVKRIPQATRTLRQLGISFLLLCYSDWGFFWHDVENQFFRTAKDGELRSHSNSLVGQYFMQVIDTGNGLLVKTDDYIPFHQSRVLSRAVILNGDK